MSMFKTLAQQAAISPVTLTIFDINDFGLLRVIITQKKSESDKSHVPLNLAITGTPDQLDTELPLALAEAAAAPTRTIAEQVKAQAASIAADEDDDNETPAKRKPGAAMVKKAAEIAKEKKTAQAVAKATAKANAAAKKVQARDISAKPKAKASIKPAAKMAVPVIEPLIKKPAATAATPAPKKTAAEIKAEKGADCLADLRAAIAAHGAAVTRKQYAAMAKTGRSFETVFGAWETFKAAAEKYPTTEAWLAACNGGETKAADIELAELQPFGAAETERVKAFISTTAGPANVDAAMQAAPAPTESAAADAAMNIVPPAAPATLELTPPGATAKPTADIF